jgi:hypothetical protein
MAFIRIRFNEGSLLRQTLLYVATFVLGSLAFLSIASVVLVSAVRSVVGAPGVVASARPPVASAATSPPRTGHLRPGRTPKPQGSVAAPSKDE